MRLTLLPRRHMTRHIPVCPYYMFVHVPVPVHPYQHQYQYTHTSISTSVYPYHNIMCDTEFHNNILNYVFLGNSFMSSSECSNNRDLACILGCREVSKVQRTSQKMLCMDVCVCMYVCMYVCMFISQQAQSSKHFMCVYCITHREIKVSCDKDDGYTCTIYYPCDIHVD